MVFIGVIMESTTVVRHGMKFKHEKANPYLG